METLQERFKLSERQAQAILDMRLRRLTGLERDKIENEYNELLGYISELEEILADDEVLLQLVRDELTDIKERFGDERRTEIQLGGLDDLEDEDLIPEEQIVITLSHNNYIKRLPVSTYRSQHRGGRGVQGMNTLEEDFVSQLVTLHMTTFYSSRIKAVFINLKDTKFQNYLANLKVFQSLMRLN